MPHCQDLLLSGFAAVVAVVCQASEGGGERGKCMGSVMDADAAKREGGWWGQPQVHGGIVDVDTASGAWGARGRGGGRGGALKADPKGMHDIMDVDAARTAEG